MGKLFPPKATTAERTGLTPDDGLVFYDETEQTLYIGDGSTVGGNTLKGDEGDPGPPGPLANVVDDTSPQLGGFLDPNENYVGMDQGGNLASASPLVIGTDGDYFNLIGTTGFASMTVAANRFFILQSDGALVITHGGAITIPGGSNFTTAAGDHLLCFSTAPNTVRIFAVTKADGTPVVINVLADTSPQLGGFLDPKENYIGSNKGGDLASASPLVLGIDGDYFNLTGTTGFSVITVANNRRFRIQLDNVLVITVGASITLNNGGSDFTTAPGDIIDFQSVAANVVVGTIIKADGSSVIPPPVSGFIEGTKVATTSGSTATFTGVPAGTTMITVQFIECSNTGGGLPEIQIGDAGGFEISNYRSGSAEILSGNSNYSQYTTGFLIFDSSFLLMSGLYILCLTEASTNTWTGSGSLRSDAASATTGGGQKALSAELTQVRVSLSAGNFTAGAINISYI